MIEILQILIIFFIFSLMCFMPFNVLNSKIFNKKSFFFLDIATFNLIINFNILLLLSILPTSLDISNLIYLILYISLFIYLYLLKNYKLNLLKDFFQFKIIFFIIFLILSINVAGELNLGWDAKYFYYIKALFFVEGQNFYDLNKFENVRRWFDDLKNRPAVRKGMDVGKEKRTFGQKPDKKSLKMMFQQDSDSIKKVIKKKEKK